MIYLAFSIQYPSLISVHIHHVLLSFLCLFIVRFDIESYISKMLWKYKDQYFFSISFLKYLLIISVLYYSVNLFSASVYLNEAYWVVDIRDNSKDFLRNPKIAGGHQKLHLVLARIIALINTLSLFFNIHIKEILYQHFILLLYSFYNFISISSSQIVFLMMY